MNAMDKRATIQENFSEWYNQVIFEAELVDTSPTRGAFVIRPYGYALWENITRILDAKFKEAGVSNIYLPLLIPESFLRKEEKHVEGFSPEVAVVTYAGGKQLEEPYVIRPTSETIVYHMFARWIKSWRDLPLKINQWANVVRWEMRTRAFLRTTEILWQEGHTAHRTSEEAYEMALKMLETYRDFVEYYLAIPVITGRKTDCERFAGADTTFTIESLMPEGKALQMGTSHVLAQSFPAAFDVVFQDKDGSLKSPMCTSWAVTTRLIGALVMTHGDDTGLIMPPRIAPIQAVIIPIYKSDEQRAVILEKAEAIKKDLIKNGFSVVIDTDDQKTPGAKYYHWEVRGVPIRIEIGPRDIENNQAVLVNRAETDKQSKKTICSLDAISHHVANLCETIQKKLFERATERRSSWWTQADKLSDFGQILQDKNGLFQTGWCGSSTCEETVGPMGGTIRCILEKKQHTECFSCSQPSLHEILIAKAY